MKGTGYFVVDDRASGGKLYEADTRLCKHCQAVLVIERRPTTLTAYAYCTRCGGYVCATGLCAEVCTPVTKQIDAALRMAARDPAMGQEG